MNTFDPAEQRKLKASADVVSKPWAASTYYDDAERWTFIFWDDNQPFRRFFNQLDLSNVVELSCGHGRHAERVAPMTNRLTLVDIFDSNLDFCRNRLRAYPFVRYVKNNGYTFEPIEPQTATAIYCYDSMVHFSPDIVESYLKDAERILVPGGKALFHHSNYPAPLEKHYGQNPHARNHMTKDLFAFLAVRNNLKMVESKVIGWGGIKELDCITLVQRPT